MCHLLPKCARCQKLAITSSALSRGISHRLSDSKCEATCKLRPVCHCVPAISHKDSGTALAGLDNDSGISLRDIQALFEHIVLVVVVELLGAIVVDLVLFAKETEVHVCFVAQDEIC